jgi:hypothetical protein
VKDPDIARKYVLEAIEQGMETEDAWGVVRNLAYASNEDNKKIVYVDSKIDIQIIL